MDSTSTPLALTVTGLRVVYGDFVAIEHCSLSVGNGESVALIGPNGNGKSSIAMAIAGLVPHSGVVEVHGEVAPSGDAQWTSRHGVALVPERRQLFPQMSVADNVALGCWSWTRSLRKARASTVYTEALELFPELRTRVRQLAGTLSGGEQQMVALARGLASKATTLLIDEPCLGLAEGVSARLYVTLAALGAQGRTIVLIEENPARALEICDRAIRVERGLVREATSAGIDRTAALLDTETLG